MLDFEKNDSKDPEFFKPSTWKPLKFSDGAYTAYLTCPNGHTGILGPHHKIAADGTVTPSVVCIMCSFHEFIKLKDWKP